MEEIKIGGFYKHFKGHEIQVVGKAKHSETLENMIIYRHLGTGEEWARPEKMFLEDEDVSKKAGNITGQKHRFEPMNKKSCNEVKEGEVYRHFKGKFYYVICVGMDSETKERIIVYRHLDNSGKICTRSEEMFLEEIPERPDNITGQKHRFEKIDNLEKYNLK